MTLYWAPSAAMPTTAVMAPVTPLLTTVNTVLQVATPSNKTLKVVAFGIEFANALTVPATVELVDTGAVACTGMNAHAASGVQPYGADSQGGASDMPLGTGSTGWWKTGQAEGTITATRHGHYKILPIGAQSYEWEWSLGREFAVPVSRFLRVRVLTSVNIGTLAWILWDE